MLRIQVPPNHLPERTYSIDILLGEFLGLDYHVETGESRDYLILLENGKCLVIRDHFFSQFGDGLEYLDMKQIPGTITFASNPFLIEENIPILYGSQEMEIGDSGIYCGIDLFASSFFMLSRWEEYANPIRDRHQRFPAAASTAYRHRFLGRPIVNEYTEMLWNMLVFLGVEQQRRERSFQMVLTHDVDYIYFWKGPAQLLKTVAADVIKRRSLQLAGERFPQYWSVKNSQSKDPHDTFDWLMDVSEKANGLSRFYFMSGGVTKFDNHYRIDESRCRQIIQSIKDRGHIIGFHPSYNAYDDATQWKKEKEQLEEIVGMNVTEGRQHYLRFAVPMTWDIWDQHGMQTDSTMSYAEKEGFRCGTCYEYSVFHILQRRKLNLKELPLQVMEGSLVEYQEMDPAGCYESIQGLIQKVKKYRGSFVLLWHNSCFHQPPWRGYQSVYERVVSENARRQVYINHGEKENVG